VLHGAEEAFVCTGAGLEGQQEGPHRDEMEAAHEAAVAVVPPPVKGPVQVLFADHPLPAAILSYQRRVLYQVVDACSCFGRHSLKGGNSLIRS
jgi:hypothetical protein